MGKCSHRMREHRVAEHRMNVHGMDENSESERASDGRAQDESGLDEGEKNEIAKQLNACDEGAENERVKDDGALDGKEHRMVEAHKKRRHCKVTGSGSMERRSTRWSRSGWGRAHYGEQSITELR